MLTRLFALLLCIFASVSLAAQPKIDYTPLANRLAEYGQLTMAWDIDGLLKMTVPALFEYIPEDLLREQMEGLLSDENMEVTVSAFTVDEIGEAVLQFGAAYVRIKCHHHITFQLRSPAYRAPDFVDRMIRMLEKSYPEVTYDPANHAIKVYVLKPMFAIRASEEAAWNFVEYRPENAALMDLLVPPTVREQLK